MFSTFFVVALALACGHSLPTNLFNAHQKVSSDQLQHYIRFNDFAVRYSKSYTSQQDVLNRFAVYTQNMEQAKAQQSTEKGTAIYGETKFSDFTKDELKHMFLSESKVKDFPQGDPCNEAIYNETSPDSFFWNTQEGVVARVKDQGRCGSCWAFSVIANIEGQMKLRFNKTEELSEQILLDCDKIDYGCDGGLPLDAYKEIQRFGGLETEKDYPYKSYEKSCHLKKDNVVIKVTGSCQVVKDEEAIKTYLHKVGPLSVAVNANPLLFYKKGIHHPSSCSPEGLNHAVTLIGYGSENGTPYWLVKNSWSESWGENGYYRLYRGKNVCGISEYVTTAYVELP